MKNDDITRALFELADSDYRDFHTKLIPDVDKSKVIGVRTPPLRKIHCKNARCRRIFALASASLL